jgi:hypothetical protein
MVKNFRPTLEHVQKRLVEFSKSRVGSCDAVLVAKNTFAVAVSEGGHWLQF